MAELGRVVVYTAPTVEPVTLAEAKLHLRVSHLSDDQLIARLIGAAREFVEAHTGLFTTTATVDVYFDAAPASSFELPVSPVASITSITTYDTTGTGTTMTGTDYSLDAASVPARVVLKDTASWPSGLRSWNAVVVRAVVGSTSAAAVPARLRQAVLLLVGELYERREQSSEKALSVVPLSVMRLLAQLRRLAGLA